MTTTQPKNGTVTLNGRTYTHKTDGKCFARLLDTQGESLYFSILTDKGYEYVSGPFTSLRQAEVHGVSPLPATTSRPRELKDVIAELGKGGVTWVSKDGGEEWYISRSHISPETVQEWNFNGVLLSPNPFKENPTIIGPEITEEVKP